MILFYFCDCVGRSIDIYGRSKYLLSCWQFISHTKNVFVPKDKSKTKPIKNSKPMSFIGPLSLTVL